MRNAPRLLSALVAVVAIALDFGGFAQAASPQLSAILPPGVERGREHVLTFTGDRLKDVEEVLLYDSGVTVKKIEAVDAKNVRVTVDVAADCPLGQHLAQLRTKTGISDFRPYFVGVLPNVDEKEPNNSFDAVQPIDINVCVSGVLVNEDSDYYRVQAKKGQRLSVEIEGIRLGQAFFDPYIAVFDKNRTELASSDGTALTGQDSALSIVVPEEGEYTMLVRDASYRGADNCRYRLHVGNFPRPLVAYPAGGKLGEQVKVRLLGDATGPIEQQVSVPADATADANVTVANEQGIAPTAITFRSSADSNVLEVEPNDGFDTATAAELPLALNGILEKPGDVDFFKLSAKKGQVWEVECYANRIGSPLDTVLNIYKADKASLAGNDDARGRDSYVRWQVPDDGDYYIRVADQLKRGGETFVYRVELTPVTRSLKFGIPRIDRYSQTRQTIVVPRGNRYGTLVLATRTDFGGPIEMLSQNLIPGVTMASRPMHPSMNLVPVVFEAAADAPIDGDLIDMRAKLADEKQPPLEGGFENVADFVLGDPNNALYVKGVAQKLAMAVVEKVPYRLEIVQPKAPLVRAGTMNLKVLVHRDEGFDAPLTVQFPFNPPGVSSTGSITIEKGKNEGIYQLNANGGAAVGKWPMMVIGAADIDGQAWVSSQLAELEVADRYVAFEMKRAACNKGDATQIQCALDQNTPFEGNAKAELLGLPPGVSAEPIEFNKDTKEIAFELKTTKDTPVGNHKSLLCQVTITQNGEPIVGSVGNTELRVNEPPAKPAANQVAEAAKPAAPKKPMSRLEQLRARVLQTEAKKP
jgi:hypothetical protein